MSTNDLDAGESIIDPQLEDELNRRKYDRTNTTKANIIGISIDPENDTIEVELSVPVDVDSQVTTSLEMPSDRPLSESTVGHILTAHNYEPEQAKGLLGETVSVYYEGNSWEIADPVSSRNDAENGGNADGERIEYQLDQQEESSDKNRFAGDYWADLFLRLVLGTMSIMVLTIITVAVVETSTSILNIKALWGFPVDDILIPAMTIGAAPLVLVAMVFILLSVVGFARAAVR